MAAHAAPLQRDGKALILAYDHGLEHGPVDFTAAPQRLDPASVINLAGHDAVTALAVQKGIAERYGDRLDDDTALLVKCSGKTALKDAAPYSAQACSVDHAVDIGADAVGFTLYPGSRREGDMVERFQAVQEAARRHDIPAVTWVYPRGGDVDHEDAPGTVQYAARIGLELGADMVKVKYPAGGEEVDAVAAAAGEVPVVLSGGARADPVAFLRTVRKALDSGFTGLAVGRNVWQREDPDTYLDALESVVFDGADGDTAAEEHEVL